jgi:hypothetical protein
MAAKKSYKISQDGVSRDATPEEVEVIELTRADSIALDAINYPAN